MMVVLIVFGYTYLLVIFIMVILLFTVFSITWRVIEKLYFFLLILG